MKVDCQEERAFERVISCTPLPVHMLLTKALETFNLFFRIKMS